MKTRYPEDMGNLQKLSSCQKAGLIAAEERKSLSNMNLTECRELVEAWRSRGQRSRISQETGISPERLRQLVFCSNVFSMQGPGSYTLQHQLCNVSPEWKVEDALADKVDDLADASLPVLVQHFSSVNRKWEIFNLAQISWNHLFRWGKIFFVLGLIGLAWAITVNRLRLMPPPVNDLLGQINNTLIQQTAWRELAELLLYTCIGGSGMVLAVWTAMKLSMPGFEKINKQLNITPRDVFIRNDAMLHLSRWQQIVFIGGDVLSMLQFSLPVVIFIACGMQDSSLPLVSLLIYAVTLVWIIARFYIFHCAYASLKTHNGVPFPWAESARRRAAGELLLKLIWVGVLVIGIFLVIAVVFSACAITWEKWITYHTPSFRAQIMDQVHQIEDPTQKLGMKKNAETTINLWQSQAAERRIWVNNFLLAAFQLHRMLGLGMLTAISLGWFIFIEHKSWLTVVVGFTFVYLLEDTAPDYLVYALYGPLKWLNLPVLTYIIGFTWALGKKVMEDNQAEQIELECQKCYCLWPRGTKACGGCGKHDLRPVLGFTGEEKK